MPWLPCMICIFAITLLHLHRIHTSRMHVFQIAYFPAVFHLSVLDAVLPCVQHWTQVIVASNTYSWLNIILKRWFHFACRFPHLSASDTCFDTCASCRTPVFSFTPRIARFPVVFCVVFLSPLCTLTSCGFYLVYRICLLSPLPILRSHRVILFGFSALVFFRFCISYLHCVVLSVFCFIACICIRAVMLTIWSSLEPGFARFGTLIALLST